MPIALAFRPATPADIPLLRTLAERIWRQSYAAMLSPMQIDYMLGWMYGAETIAAEMSRGVLWTLVESDGMPIGYLSVTLGTSAELHKLYLLPDRQGAGIGQQMLNHVQELARRHESTEVRLRVNKSNARALKSYERAGFRIVDALVADIGGGYVMDDYVLARPVASVLPLVKICGLSTPDTLAAALDAGSDWIGLVFFAKSPRNVSFDQAQRLADQARGRAEIVALTVDADDDMLAALMARVAPDRLQFHGRETPERVEIVKARFGRPIMKAIGVAEAEDLAAADPFRTKADDILFDAKPPKGAALPGGNGLAFDWSIMRGVAKPFILSGGLSPDNVSEALRVSGATGVDVSSGVETAPGRKDPGLIRAFIEAARRVPARP